MGATSPLKAQMTSTMFEHAAGLLHDGQLPPRGADAPGDEAAGREWHFEEVQTHPFFRTCIQNNEFQVYFTFSIECD